MFENILDNFRVEGKLIRFGEYGSGHINATYLVEMEAENERHKYILRKINSSIFHSPQIVAENSTRITKHIREKLRIAKAGNISERALTFVETERGENYYEDNSGEVWTLSLFIENAHTVDYISNEAEAFAAAKAFGNFIKLLLDFDASKLAPSISGFHDWRKRMRNFQNAVSAASERRIAAKEEIEFLNDENLKTILTDIANLIDGEILPVRITHNDTKISNVMLSNVGGEPLAVIDLDTVMPGLIIYDFGDMVRSFCSPAPEDHKNTEEVQLRTDIFRALCGGFLSEVGEFLTREEFDNLLLGAKLIIYIQAIRFLTDYLENDVYYKTDYEDHNLVRAKNQIALLRSFLSEEKYLKEIIEEIKNSYVPDK